MVGTCKGTELHFNIFAFCLTNLKYDVDGSGFITDKEIRDVLKNLGKDMPRYKIRQIIDGADTNENGKVDFDEFLKVSLNFSKLVFFKLFRESPVEKFVYIWCFRYENLNLKSFIITVKVLMEAIIGFRIDWHSSTLP